MLERGKCPDSTHRAARREARATFPPSIAACSTFPARFSSVKNACAGRRGGEEWRVVRIRVGRARDVGFRVRLSDAPRSRGADPRRGDVGVTGDGRRPGARSRADPRSARVGVVDAPCTRRCSSPRGARPEADLAEHRLEAGEGEQGGARELVHLRRSERRDRARRAASKPGRTTPPIFLADPWAPTPLRPRADASAARNVPVARGMRRGSVVAGARAHAEAERGSRRRCHRHRTTVGVRVRRAARSDVRRARRYARQPRTPPTLSSR